MVREGVVQLGGPFALLIRRQSRLSRSVKGILVAGFTVTTLVSSTATASAQNIFEALFGRLWNAPPVTSDADPNAPPRSLEPTRSEGGIAYCVRLCDGRYFPIQRHSGVSSAQTCSSFCPASATKIYNGNGIDHAVAPTASAIRSLAPRSHTGRRSSPTALATAGTPLAWSVHPLMMIRHCVPATSSRPLLV